MKSVVKERLINYAPYLAALVLFLALFCSWSWNLFDGSSFHMQNFLLGDLNNKDFLSRVGATIFTEMWDLLYLHLGGKSFFISRQLFVFGYTFHIFYPIFFLTFVGRKFPEKLTWCQHSIWIYLLSLFIIRGYGNFFLVSEMFAAHTFIWMTLLTYEAGPQFRKLHIFCALCSAFAHQAAIFTYFIINAREFLRTKKISYLHVGLIFLVVAFHLQYSWVNKGAVSFLAGSFERIDKNWNVHFYLGMIILLFGLKKFFRYQFVLIGLIGALFYLCFNTIAIWHFSTGRVVGLVFIIILQTLYFLVPWERYSEYLLPRAKVFTWMALFLICYQNLELERVYRVLTMVLEKEKRSIPYKEARTLNDPYLHLNGYNVRMYTLSMVLMKSRHITAWIEPQVSHHMDFICEWGPEIFLERIREKNLTLSDSVKPKCDLPLPKDRRI